MYALSWCLTNINIDLNSQYTLILLYIKPPPLVYSSLDITGYLFGSDIIAAIEKYGKELADSVMGRAQVICNDYPNIIQIEKKVGSGDAKDKICEILEKLGADMLVIGSHGYGSIKRALLGSVSDYCSKTAKCPVLIVKRPTT
ncbi:hypothetical protein IFM89_000682 [Coptis chinensis]|uniref:UspA domain-containing protein n=1 Tax=Coptis chinensis TaxID=261450 RepID=A0A835IKG7_9MAGN|nr:hypothetical protein IFM89_000682 [Coptis chinensis]